MQFVLAAGFVFHIFYASFLTLTNQRARPVKYDTIKRQGTSSWSSRNMFIIGSIILLFLVIHLKDFFYQLKFGVTPEITYNGVIMENTYKLVTELFSIWYYSLFYVITIIFLGLHLYHSFWSAIHTLGLNNNIWKSRLKIIGTLYAIIVSLGFISMPVYFYFTSL